MDGIHKQLLENILSQLVDINTLLQRLVKVEERKENKSKVLDKFRMAPDKDWLHTNAIGIPLDDSQVVIQPSSWVEEEPGPPLARQTPPPGGSRPNSE